MIGDYVTAVRCNHALEHATISVLMAKLGPNVRLMGRAAVDGFYVYGNVSTEMVARAANEGLSRLKGGDRSMAVSPLCGTNLVTAGFLAGVASMLAMRRKNGVDSLLRVLLAATTAVVLAQPLGRLVQQYVTTSYDVSGFSISEVVCLQQGKHARHKIKTVRS